MALDPVRNFAKVEVSTGYDASATSIDLASGEAAKLPDPATDGAFNVVWYDSDNFASPEEDPNVEIIRVTGVSGDTLTVTRAQESTTASTKNTAGATYKMINAPTQKMIEDIQEAIGNAISTDPITTGAYDISIDGSTTPLPISVSNDVANKSNAVNNTDFLGFTTDDITGETISSPDYTNTTAPNGSTSFSVTANAGDDRVIVFGMTENETSPTVSSVEWNGIQGEFVGVHVQDGIDVQVWIIPIGDSASAQTNDLTITGSSGSRRCVVAVYQNVNQTDPYGSTQGGGNNDGDTSDVLISTNHPQGYGKFIAISYALNQSPGVAQPGDANIVVTGDDIRMFDFVGASGTVFQPTTGNPAIKKTALLFGISSTTTPVELLVQHYFGVAGGFTGLEVGKKYYLQDTAGDIGQTPGSTEVLVGKAISDTELIVIQS